MYEKQALKKQQFFKLNNIIHAIWRIAQKNEDRYSNQQYWHANLRNLAKQQIKN